MSESMIGKWLYVCDCGASCPCAYRSELPSNCSCGHPAVLRRVLAEDELNFYVAETGHADARNELGDAPFKGADGRSLQPFRKAFNEKANRKLKYKGRDVRIQETGNSCVVTIGEKEFRATQHGKQGRWMGFPCYTMFASSEAFARSLVDSWDVVGNDAILAPPRSADAPSPVTGSRGGGTGHHGSHGGGAAPREGATRDPDTSDRGATTRASSGGHAASSSFAAAERRRATRDAGNDDERG